MTRKFLHPLFCGIFRLLFILLTRVIVQGKENIPSQGGYIIAANHLSMIEVPLIYCIINRDYVTGWVAKKHQSNPFFRWIVNSMGGIWLNRQEIDTSALRAARDHLRAGGVIGLAPEGTRSGTGALIQAKTGAAFLADQARVPILPVGVSGTWQITNEILTLRRPRITVRFGELFTLPPIDRSNREAGLNSNTNEIMCHIAVLLPPENRGVYVDHPRVLELLQTQSDS